MSRASTAAGWGHSRGPVGSESRGQRDTRGRALSHCFRARQGGGVRRGPMGLRPGDRRGSVGCCWVLLGSAWRPTRAFLGAGQAQCFAGVSAHQLPPVAQVPQSTAWWASRLARPVQTLLGGREGPGRLTGLALPRGPTSQQPGVRPPQRNGRGDAWVPTQTKQRLFSGLRRELGPLSGRRWWWARCRGGVGGCEQV